MDMIPHQIFLEHIYSLLLDSPLTYVNSTSITGVISVNEYVTWVYKVCSTKSNLMELGECQFAEMGHVFLIYSLLTTMFFFAVLENLNAR